MTANLTHFMDHARSALSDVPFGIILPLVY